MSFKSNILKKYIDNEHIHVIIGHDSWKYLGLLLKNSLYIFGLFSLYIMFINFMKPNIFLSVLFAIVGLFVYVRFIINFMDIYLDALLLTDSGVIIFKWDGLFINKSELVNWDYLAAVQDSQLGIADIVLNKGNLILKRAGTEYVFDNVSHPTKKASMILELQAKIMSSRNQEPEEPEPDIDKFDVLVETLGEVILDYVKKDKFKK